MALSLAIGVLFATIITLFPAPIAYAILDDLQRPARRLRAARGAAVPASQPASGALTPRC